MSYTRPTLISQIVQKGRKVSINPRNENDAGGGGCFPEKESYEASFRSSAKDEGWKEEEEEEDGRNNVEENHDTVASRMRPRDT